MTCSSERDNPDKGTQNKDWGRLFLAVGGRSLKMSSLLIFLTWIGSCLILHNQALLEPCFQALLLSEYLNWQHWLKLGAFNELYSDK